MLLGGNPPGVVSKYETLLTAVASILYGCTMNENDKPLNADDKFGMFLILCTLYLAGGWFTLFMGLGLNALGFAVLPVEPSMGQFVSFYLFWPLFFIKFVAFYVYWLVAILFALLTL